MHHNISMMI